MTCVNQSLKYAVAAIFLALPLQAQDRMEDLFAFLQTVDPVDAPAVEEKIWLEWSKSGSAAIDLLLRRGREALEAGEYTKAMSHFTAVVDHAPDFAEGYHMRATAYFQADLIGPAMLDLEQTLALEPRHFGALQGVAAILEGSGKYDLALEAMYQLRSIHPHMKEASAYISRLEGLAGRRAL